MGPVLLHPEEETPQTILHDSSTVHRIIRILVDNFDYFFLVLLSIRLIVLFCFCFCDVLLRLAHRKSCWHSRSTQRTSSSRARLISFASTPVKQVCSSCAFIRCFCCYLLRFVIVCYYLFVICYYFLLFVVHCCYSLFSVDIYGVYHLSPSADARPRRRSLSGISLIPVEAPLEKPFASRSRSVKNFNISPRVPPLTRFAATQCALRY